MIFLIFITIKKTQNKMAAENFIANNYHTKVGLEADKLIEDNTGIVVSFEEIAESYHQAKLKSLDIPIVSQRSELLAFAKEMQNIGFNEMDDPEKVVDIYIKANCC